MVRKFKFKKNFTPSGIGSGNCIGVAKNGEVVDWGGFGCGEDL